jgi:tetratricopeptide (TPR) repeat protein
MADSHQDEIAKLEALYASNPGGRVFTHLAEAYRKAGNLERAREIAEDGLRRHEGYASAHVVMGRIFLDMGQRDNAAAEYRRVLQLDSENRIALRGLADHERERGSAEEALRHYRQLQQLDPGDAELAATVATLDSELSAGPAAPPPPAPAGPDYFGGFTQEPSPHGAPPTTAAERFDPPLAAEDTAAPPPADAASAPAEVEALPPSLDWTGAGDSPEPESPDLRLDWDVSVGDAVAGATPTPEADEDVGDSIGSQFRLDVPGAAPAEAAPAEADPAAAWRELQEAASSALPPVDHEALPAADHAALPPADYDALPPGEAETASEPASAEALGDVAYRWDDEPDTPPTAETPAAEEALGEVVHGWQQETLPAAGETEVYTETLAELYRAQGFHERAVEVYRALLADRPGDQRLMMKLRELEGVGMDEAEPAPFAESWQALADTMEQGVARDRETDATEAIGYDEELGDVAGETERPEPEWVEMVESAWTGSAGAVLPGEGLYTPPAEEPDAAADAVPVARMLAGLLDWKPTRGPASDPEEELLLLDEVAEAADPVDAEGLAEASDSPYGGDADAATGPRTFSGGAEPAGPMPWEESGGHSAEPPAERSGDVADAMPWDAPSPAGAAAGPGDVGNPFDTEGGEPPPTSKDDADEDEDDDDLEMFRSWLQSLRR